MLSSYPVQCPYEDCGWTGNLVPSNTPGGSRAEIGPGAPAWFQCPLCQRDWEVRIRGDNVIVLAAVEQGR